MNKLEKAYLVSIRPMQEEDLEGVIGVVQALPEWFDADARSRAIPIDLQHQDGYVAQADGSILGFITLYVAEGRAQIGWMGVLSGHQGQGIGGRLIAAAEDYCRERGIAELATYTLGDSVDYEPYEATRAFYISQGFEVYQRSQTDNPGCPEEIKIKKSIHDPSDGS